MSYFFKIETKTFYPTRYINLFMINNQSRLNPSHIENIKFDIVYIYKWNYSRSSEQSIIFWYREDMQNVKTKLSWTSYWKIPRYWNIGKSWDVVCGIVYKI